MPPSQPPIPMGQQRRAAPYIVAAYGLLLATILLFILTGVVLDSWLAPLSWTQQRWIVSLTLILPAALGLLASVAALRQRKHPIAIILPALVLNALVALFFIALLAFTG
jgi:hypothetical protein